MHRKNKWSINMDLPLIKVSSIIPAERDERENSIERAEQTAMFGHSDPTYPKLTNMIWGPEGLAAYRRNA